MSLIEGIGDEVTQFTLGVLFVLVVIVAWWSTGYRQDRYRQDRYRTVVLMERNVRRLYRLVPGRMIGRMTPQMIATIRWSRRTAPQNESAITVPTASTTPDTAEAPTLGDVHQTDIPPPDIPTESSVSESDAGVDNETSVVAGESAAVSSPQDVEMDSIVNAMDSETCVLRNRRLAFFKAHTEGSPDSTATSTETDEKKLTSDDTIGSSDDKKDEKDELDPNETKEPNSDNIRIRLKYLNDDQKMVEGSLHEALGEFKRRHFRGELSARKLVRLIFNGQVLQREGATLASCGLFDNCVVHCLVHQPRTPNQYSEVQHQLNPTAAPDGIHGNSSGVNAQLGDHMQPTDGQHDDRDWDLSHILLTILASILSIAWYCHIRFSSLFGVAASIAMLGLTALYFIAVICVYYPETQQSTTPPTTTGTPEPVAAE